MSDDLKDGNIIEDTDNPTTDQELDRSSVKERGLLTEFQVFEEDPNTSGAIAPPITLLTTPTVIARLDATTTPPSFLVIDDTTDRVWLNATVGWEAITNGTTEGRVDVLFSIYRDSPPPTGTLIFSTLDSAEVGADIFVTTHLSHVDLTPLDCPGIKLVNYYLTAELPLTGSAADVIGPITFTGAEIERNRSSSITTP